MKSFIHNLPKIELHLHIEGTLEPQMMFELSQKNNIKIPYQSIEEIHQAYEFSNLQSFLDLYYAGASVLQTREDFYHLTLAYLKKCKEENVVHTEIFFDPQTHTHRGIALAEVIEGITQAQEFAKVNFGISSYLIACILRHLSQEDGLKTLDELLAYKDKIIGIGLDSSEIGNPPSKFKQLFAKAKAEGFLLVAHAGEEGDSSYIREALEVGVARIDHGVRCEEDEELLKLIIDRQIPLTMCPLSNLKLKVISSMQESNFTRLLKRGACVTINSDDPAYFGGYINDNFYAIAQNFDLSYDDLIKMSLNALKASFLPQKEKEKIIQKIKEFQKVTKS